MDIKKGIISLVVVGGLVAAACGGQAKSAPPTSPPTATATQGIKIIDPTATPTVDLEARTTLLKQVSEQMARDMYDRDLHAVYNNFSQSCKNQYTYSAWSDEINKNLDGVEKLTGVDLSEVPIKDMALKNVTDHFGEAAVLFNEGDQVDDASWVAYIWEDGEWKLSC